MKNKLKFSSALLFFIVLLEVLIAEEMIDFPRKVKSDVNREILLDKRPNKLFVSYVGALEILEELTDASQIVAAPKIAVDPKFSNCVDFSKKISFLFDSLDIEQVERCNPDLVILASFNDPRFLEQLNQFNRKYVIWRRFDSFEDICDLTLNIGLLIGEEKKAQSIVLKMQEELQRIKNETKPNNLKVISFGEDFYTAGKKTILGDMIEKAGLINAAAKFGLNGHYQINIEELIKIDPEYILILGEDEGAKKRFLDLMKKQPNIELVRAFQLENIVWIKTSLSATTSSHFIEGVKEIRQKVLDKASSANSRLK